MQFHNLLRHLWGERGEIVLQKKGVFHVLNTCMGTIEAEPWLLGVFRFFLARDPQIDQIGPQLWTIATFGTSHVKGCVKGAFKQKKLKIYTLRAQCLI